MMVNIQPPKHISAIYEDFSKILFEYENSYHRALEVSLKSWSLKPGISKIEKGNIQLPKYNSSISENFSKIEY